MFCNLQWMRLGDRFLTLNDYFGKGGWRFLNEAAYDESSSSDHKEPLASCTADAIKQVRSKRPMSRIEVPSDISSKDEHCAREGEKRDDDLSSSSSNMISFELSNGNPCGPHVPTSWEDDQYVEYALDDLTGFPSCPEEEERMFMEAVIESLRDMEIRNPQAEQSPSGVSTVPVGPSQKDDQQASSQESSRPMETSSSSIKLKAESISSVASEVPGPLEAESQILASEPSLSSGGASIDSSPAKVSSLNTSVSSFSSDSVAGVHNSSDTDVSHNTKATLTVEKNNQAGHVKDGSMRRWDFNFFRNSSSSK